MGLMGGVLGFGSAARDIGQAVGGVAEVFVGNKAGRDAAGAARFEAVVAEQAAEFARAPTGRFHGFVDGLNRLPRPMLAIGTLALFVYAMVEPVGFGLRMEGLQHVPEPLWWLLGAIVSFYFGAREFHYWRGGAPAATPVATTAALRKTTVAAESAEEEAAPLPFAALRPAPRPAAQSVPASKPRPTDPHYNAALEEWRASRG